MGVEEIREEIAKCDLRIVELIAERNRLASEMGRAKRSDGSAVCVPKVEEQVRDRYVSNGTAKGISEETLKKISSILIEESKRVQERIIDDRDRK